MSGGSPIGTTASQLIKNILKLITTSDDDSNTYGSKLKKQAKVVEIPVEERILIVPLYLESHAIFVAVNLMGRRR